MGNCAEHCARRGALFVDLEVFEDLFDQIDLIAVVVDGEAGIAAQVLDVAAKPACAQRVERAHREASGQVATNQGIESLAQLAGSLVGERHRQEVVGIDVLDLKEVRHAVHDYPRLARAGPSQDQQRPIDMRDRFALVLVQAFEQAFRAVGC